MKNRRKFNEWAVAMGLAQVGTLLLFLGLIAACQSKPCPEKSANQGQSIELKIPSEARSDSVHNAPPESPEGPDASRSERLTKHGVALYNKALYREARDDFKQALAANPDNVKARYLYNMCRVFLGEIKVHYEGIGSFRASERMAHREQELLELRRLFKEGCDFLDSREFQSAITNFESILERFKWSPYKIEDEGIEEGARQRLSEARKLLADADTSQGERTEIVEDSHVLTGE